VQIEELAAELQKLAGQVAERNEAGETVLSHLLATGDLDGALRVKSEQARYGAYWLLFVRFIGYAVTGGSPLSRNNQTA
jgi:hypothetical protein